MTARIERPLSPHIQTYRWTLTMALSHRTPRHRHLALLFSEPCCWAWWLISAASGPQLPTPTCRASPRASLGRLIVFGYTWALLQSSVQRAAASRLGPLATAFKASEARGPDLGRADRRQLPQPCCCGSSPTRSGAADDRTPIPKTVKSNAHPARPRPQPRRVRNSGNLGLSGASASPPSRWCC